MAGFDLDKQRSGTIPGLGRVEAGYFDFSDGASTTEVPTRLTANSYVMGFGIGDSTQVSGGGQTHQLVVTTDGDVSTGGNVTFKRVGYIDVSARYRYMLIGW